MIIDSRCLMLCNKNTMKEGDDDDDDDDDEVKEIQN